jgi:hypothetical protein
MGPKNRGTRFISRLVAFYPRRVPRRFRSHGYLRANLQLLPHSNFVSLLPPGSTWYANNHHSSHQNAAKARNYSNTSMPVPPIPPTPPTLLNLQGIKHGDINNCGYDYLSAQSFRRISFPSCSFTLIPSPLPRCSPPVRGLLTSRQDGGLRHGTIGSAVTLMFSRLSRRSVFIMVYVLADPALPDLLRRRLRAGPLPVPHAPTASGWSNSSRVVFFLLLDQDALFTAHSPLHLFRLLLDLCSGFSKGWPHFSAGKVSSRLRSMAMAQKPIRSLVAAMTPEELFCCSAGPRAAMAGGGMSL